ncbi:MAG: DUF1127 domain-containing protein [Gammaproteobacteria bacterium]|nr:DUF1127 domain-containing protein [Gammaproteobacteria bacterium]
MHTQTVHDDGAVPSAALQNRLLNWLEKWQHLIETVQVWQDRSRQRQQLARLSSSQLKDIGISRADVWCEVNKPFWKP